MAALTRERRTDTRAGKDLHLPVLTGVKIYDGALVVLVPGSGMVKPAVTETGSICLGRARKTVDNTAGASGDLFADISTDISSWANSSAGDEIAIDDIGKLCYLVDDQTVALTNGGSTRSVAGRIIDVDAEGVWVDPNFRA